MTKISNRFRWLAGVAVLAMTPALAQAYIDPGSGAYMVQALFTVVAAGLFYVRHPIRSLKALRTWLSERRRPRPVQAAESASPPDADVGRAQHSQDG